MFVLFGDCFTFKGPVGSKIVLAFYVFETEPTFDVVTLYDGEDTTSRQIIAYVLLLIILLNILCTIFCTFFVVFEHFPIKYLRVFMSHLTHAFLEHVS